MPGEMWRPLSRPEYGGGLLLASSDGRIPQEHIQTASRLGPIIIDRLRVQVLKDGKTQKSHIPTGHLNTMLASEVFLLQFRVLDEVATSPRFLENFDLTVPGYNNGGNGQCILHIGEAGRVSQSTDTIRAFLDVMDFATNADRTNAVAAALTVMLRNHWPGGKPVLVVTSTKSHGGKDTVILFAAGFTPQTSISYEPADWALQAAFVASLRKEPELGLVNVENARLAKRTLRSPRPFSSGS